MSKRRLLLNENQLDITGSGGNSGTVYRFSQSGTLVTKTTSLLNGDILDAYGHSKETLINTSFLTGSRNFTASVECLNESNYVLTGRALFTTGGGSPAPTYAVRINFFGHEFRSSFALQGASATTARYYVDFEFRFGFLVLSGTNTLRANFSYTSFEETGSNLVGRGGTSLVFERTISGSSDIDVIASGDTGTVAQCLEITCEQLVALESGAPVLSNLKWLQTTTVNSTGLDSALLVPDIGSLTFTPSEMTVGKKYRVTFFHYLDEPNNGDVNFDIKFGGNTFLGITTLSTGNGHVNYYDFILEFKVSSVYMYLMAQRDSLVVPAFLFASYNSSINQSIEIISKVSFLDHAIVYSKCEILN